ncbi:hypothetical protein [Hymenobacter arizonensis]|uniref:Uncharacterized protein n=1 Tax=Hymenobacter arizonensis TaxID=1227077 RepID=A0A1I6BER8_HYMAR|nr:hypothetical protein [Hymenobacter arizonensis]SFQ79404.1 hypothetical protein SAMN04515668_4437 [Hymenobacter arizonensis]
MTKLYLDIDGVLLTAKHTRPAPGVEAFVAFVTQHFACYWLTTHCQGDQATALRYLAAYLPASSLAQLGAVLPTTWDALKPEAIDLSADFYWLEDRPFQAEIACLEAAGVADRLLVVDLNTPEALRQLQETLRQALQNQQPKVH